ncbi:MAG TPA: hypothetical protein VH061_13225 [Solirubrobacteraceae bacterium]|jgi:hypothetical protein|nr:hypothetical protein [Solirubrobacteraceae bacterium]
MRGIRRSVRLCTTVTALLGAVALAPSAAFAEPGPIAFETSIGQVSCGIDPAAEPGPEAISTFQKGPHLKVSILETGALLCQTTLGEVEVTSAELPWHLNVNTEKRTAKLRGAPRLVLEARLVELPSIHCLYQAGKATATVLSEEPLSVALSVPRVRLNKHLSSALCPAVEPLSVSVTLP